MAIIRRFILPECHCIIISMEVTCLWWWWFCSFPDFRVTPNQRTKESVLGMVDTNIRNTFSFVADLSKSTHHNSSIYLAGMPVWRYLLPELKKLLSFLWRSPYPFSRILDENDPYFVVRLVTVFFHEKTPSVFAHPALIEFTLSRLFRKSSADGSLKMVSAGQNASLAAAILSLLRSATCSLRNTTFF